MRSFENPKVELTGQSVLVTGGTGSFGRAFVRRLLGSGEAHRIIVFSRDEQKQEALSQELAREFPSACSRMRYFIGDVRDTSRLELAMRDVDVFVTRTFAEER